MARHWMDKLCYIHAIEYYAAISENDYIYWLEWSLKDNMHNVLLFQQFTFPILHFCKVNEGS